MEQGAIPEADPRLLARAVLGLYNSVFHWYRPRGSLALTDVADFYVARCLAVVGLPMDLAKTASGDGRRASGSRSRGSSKRGARGQAATGSR
jgi:hypothetical protein